VALRDLESVESLITLAIHLSSSMDAELVALHVVEVPAATPIDAEDEIIDHAGKEILAAAIRVAELLIIGHRRPHPNALTELLLGSTVLHVAHHAPCRVIIQIPPPKPREVNLARLTPPAENGVE
jgi:hypothetical protein